MQRLSYEMPRRQNCRRLGVARHDWFQIGMAAASFRQSCVCVVRLMIEMPVRGRALSPPLNKLPF